MKDDNQEFRSSGVQEFRSSGVQEFRSSGVQEFRSSGVLALRKKTSKVKCAFSDSRRHSAEGHTFCKEVQRDPFRRSISKSKPPDANVVQPHYFIAQYSNTPTLQYSDPALLLYSGRIRRIRILQLLNSCNS
jgi:hypothetical protein